MESFGLAYKALAAGKPMAASDHLNKLSPFMDDQNRMQLKGRLRHADASHEMKHPTLLSARHPIVRKLIEDARESNYHRNEVCPQHFAAELLGNWTPKRAQQREADVC